MGAVRRVKLGGFFRTAFAGRGRPSAVPRKSVRDLKKSEGGFLNMPGVVVIFDSVTGILAFVVHFVFLHVALVDVLGGHA